MVRFLILGGFVLIKIIGYNDINFFFFVSFVFIMICGCFNDFKCLRDLGIKLNINF